MAKITLNAPFKEQQEILSDKTRFRVLAIGRRWGKTETLMIALANRMINGESCWFASPTHQNNKRVFPIIKGIFQSLSNVYINNSDLVIRLPQGGNVRFVSLHEPDNLRGEGLHHIFIDEMAFVSDGIWDTILRPMLVTTQGGATFSSSPNGTGNDFHKLYLRGLDPLEPDWISYHYPSGSSPLVPKHELVDIRRNTPERVYRQEYLAEFLEDGGAVFRNLANCTHEPLESTDEPRSVVIGVDWGRANDFTVLVALDVESGLMVDFDRYNSVDWETQRGRLVAMASKYNTVRILAEENSIGQPNIEALRAAGLDVDGFTTTADSKRRIINQLSLAFEQQTIGILNEPALLGELQAFTIEKLPSGNYRYTAPSGLHDDCVLALAIAYEGKVNPVSFNVFNANPFYG